MSMTAYLQIVRRWWWLLLATAVAGALAALSVTALMTPTYESSATLLVAPARPVVGTPERADLEASALLTDTYRRMISARPLLERATIEHGLGISPGALAGVLSVESATGSQVIEVSATASSGRDAQSMLTAVVETFVVAPEVERVGGPDSIVVLSPANLPSQPITPQPRLNAILGGLLALAAAGVAVIAIEHGDNRVRSPQDVQRLTRLPMLGRLRRFPSTGDGVADVRSALRGDTALGEEYRSARERLLLAMSDDGNEAAALHRTLLVASPTVDDGRTTVAANLAVTYGLAGYRVLLLDANLRTPAQHRLFNVEHRDGLTELLTDPALTLKRVAQPARRANVELVVAGQQRSGTSELLRSERMSKVLQEARSRYDLVIIDSPAILEVSDALILAGVSDHAVLVVREGQTREEDLLAAAQLLDQSRARLIGVFLNGASVSDGPRWGGPESARRWTGGLTSLLRGRRPATEGADGSGARHSLRLEPMEQNQQSAADMGGADGERVKRPWSG